MANGFRRLIRRVDRMEDVYRRGDLERPWAECAEILAAAGGCAPSEAAVLRARCLELQAIILRDRGEQEAALRAHLAAEAAIVVFPEHERLLGRIRISLVQLCALLGFHEDADRYARLATENLTGTEYEPYLRALSEEPEDVEDPGKWQEHAAELRRRSTELRAGPDQGRNGFDVERYLELQRQLAGLHIAYGDDDEAFEGFIAIAGLALALLEENSDYRAFLELTDAMAFAIDRPGIGVEEALDDLTARGFPAAARIGSAELAGQSHFLAATAAYLRDDLRTSMSHALTSVALGLDCLATTESTTLRGQLKRRLDERRDLALILATRLDDPATAAELLETERLQTLPEVGVQLSPGAPSGDLRGRLHGTAAVLGSLGQVSVHGRSTLAGRSADHFPTDRPVVPLEEVIAEVGGDGAWWWGSFVAMRRLHWAVRAPGGRMWCGTRTLTDRDVAAAEVIDLALHALGSDEERSWADPAEEERVSADMAEVVLPEPLLRQLRQRTGDLSLVVSGNWAAALPLASLVVDRRSGARLVETAVVRIQPPAFLVRRVAARARPPRTNHPLLIACMDPSGDLRHAYDDNVAALVRFGNARHDDRPRTHATRPNLVRALDRLAPSAPGIFFFSGHADFVDGDGGLNTALKLQDGDVLASGDWLGVFGRPGLPAPARVVISACDSGGASGTGGGEWLGFGAALLAAGARQVIATAWPLCDTRFTASFDAALVTALETAEDPAEELARQQRAALGEWRASVTATGAGRAQPNIWAAYQCIGTRT